MAGKGTTRRERLDLLLVERGLAESREQAHRLVFAGRVTVDGRRDVKSGMAVPFDAQIEVSTPPISYVSRGGLKLEHALDAFGLSPEGLVALDVGASTGGFTDVLLQRGARRVYAVDVGHGQLHAKLREDPRVVVMEGTNARYLRALPERPRCCTVDVSFISLLLVVPALLPLLDPAAWLVLLIKPQFEAGARHLRKGVVRDPATRRATVVAVVGGLQRLGLGVQGLVESPVLGPAGNHEYLAHARLASEEGTDPEQLAESLSW